MSDQSPVYFVRFNDEPYVWEEVSNKALFDATEPADRCILFSKPSVADAAGASEGQASDAAGPAITAEVHADAERWRYAYRHLIIGTQDARNGFEEVGIEEIDAAIEQESRNG